MTGEDRKNSRQSLYLNTPIVSSTSPTPIVNPTTSARNRHQRQLHGHPTTHNKTPKRNLASPLEDWMKIGMTLDSIDSQHHETHIPPLTSGSDVSAASISHTVIGDDSPMIASRRSHQNSPGHHKHTKDDHRRFSFEKGDLERHNTDWNNNIDKHSRQSAFLLSSLEMLKSSQQSQNSPTRTRNGIASDQFSDDEPHPHHALRQEKIHNVRRTLHKLQENLTRASLSPVGRQNNDLMSTFQSHDMNRTTYSTLSDLSSSRIDGLGNPMLTSVDESTRQSSAAVYSGAINEKLGSNHVVNDAIRPATTSCVTYTMPPSSSSGILSRNPSAKDNKQLISQSMMLDPTSASALSEELQRPYSQPIYKPPLIVRQPSNLNIGIASISTNSPKPGSSSKETAGKLSALKSAGGFLLTRENSKTDSPASLLQKSSFAPTGAGKDSSSRMFALAAALDAGDAVGKLMADMVNSKYKK
jgi:hypothetical protein